MRLKTTGELIGDRFGQGSDWVGVGSVVAIEGIYYLVTELHEDGISIESHKALDLFNLHCKDSELDENYYHVNELKKAPEGAKE